MRLNIFEIKLPLENPVLLFSLILFIILFAPILLNKLKIPHLIGLIISGAIIGPNGLNLMLRNSSIILFGTVGLLYIMFLAGLEIDLADFKKNSKKSLVFGLYTFLIPMALGVLSGLYILDFSLQTSVLLASMFASHTLIAYPIISKLGVTKNRAVNITIGGTMITDTLALLVLAVIAGMATGEITNEFWIRLSISVLLFAAIIIFTFPIIGRWFFKRFDDNISQYIFVLGMVFLGAFLAEAAGIEAIIGAFLAGLALNRLIPRTSPLMNRIEFVGNALFIPFFLIGVGMLIDYQAFFKDLETIKVAAVMTIVATTAKFLAAWITQKTFRFSVDERRLIFGLSNAQAAATLAAVLVGYNIITGQLPNGEVVRLLDETVLNGTILMILITCTIASFIAQKGAQNIALAEAAEDTPYETENEERILIPVNNLETAEELINLSVTIKSKHSRLYALNIIHNNSADKSADKKAKAILHKAVNTAAAADAPMQELLRYDLNIVNGITSVVRENNITDLILGLHHKKGITDSFLGDLTEGILTRCNTTTLIYKYTQPLATIKRYLVAVPDGAEREIGFPYWLIKVWNIAKNTGAKLVFYASRKTLDYITMVHENHPLESEFNLFDNWNDFLILSRDIKKDDCLLIILSRREGASYNKSMARIPTYLNKYFQTINYILIYPIQSALMEERSLSFTNHSVLEPISDNLDRLDDIGKTIANLFRKR
ncbi:cation:proton antiporter [Rhabdobacter roseus]|uniref:Kef-type K+ transport system membrane component KefB n=1 Tax=Rhabdobacter roseus TaxID=1655419 RepID=A0A840TWN2_9BACT|nr:cation:proton antiporter [Rhabdobacter roseus]MBB5286002.1 Kef-type K+ transport system membrane component KefB [Rhabdobacter roseus]